MEIPGESGDRPLTAVEAERASLLVMLVLLLIFIAVAAYGFVRHNSAAWVIGAVMIGGTLGTWLGNRWIRRREPNPTKLEQAMIGVAAYLIMAIPALVLAIGFMLLFPQWIR